jgi:uncharacterized protein YbaR (Trm112 family)
VKSVNSQNDFDAALKAENAVIFIHFPWSEHSLRARRLVEKWEHELMSHSASSKFDVYLLDPDAHPYTWKWVAKNATLADDSENIGETLLWLCQGAVAGGLQNIMLAEIKSLSRMTDECFLHGKRPGLSTPSPEPPWFDTELLDILCCPETHQKLQLAPLPILEKLNQQIASGRLHNRAGRALDEKVPAGLVRADGKYLYPMRQNIPILLVDEAIPLTR